MATTTTAKGKAVSARTETAVATPAADVQIKGVTRREFLFYIWDASLALMLAETSGIIIWFALPRFRPGEFGGVFTMSPKDLPAAGSSPVLFLAGKYWMSNTKDGLLALSQVCVHLGCLFKWVEVDNRFECPCHGSQYQANGTYISGPAPRSLDRYAITVTTPGGSAVTDAQGDPVKVDGGSLISIDTGKKILGKNHA